MQTLKYLDVINKYFELFLGVCNEHLFVCYIEHFFGKNTNRPAADQMRRIIGIPGVNGCSGISNHLFSRLRSDANGTHTVYFHVQSHD
jgi:hypothetical protein